MLHNNLAHNIKLVFFKQFLLLGFDLIDLLAEVAIQIDSILNQLKSEVISSCHTFLKLRNLNWHFIFFKWLVCSFSWDVCALAQHTTSRSVGWWTVGFTHLVVIVLLHLSWRTKWIEILHFVFNRQFHFMLNFLRKLCFFIGKFSILMFLPVHVFSNLVVSLLNIIIALLKAFLLIFLFVFLELHLLGHLLFHLFMLLLHVLFFIFHDFEPFVLAGTLIWGSFCWIC